MKKKIFFDGLQLRREVTIYASESVDRELHSLIQKFRWQHNLFHLAMLIIKLPFIFMYLFMSGVYFILEKIMDKMENMFERLRIGDDWIVWETITHNGDPANQKSWSSVNHT